MAVQVVVALSLVLLPLGGGPHRAPVAISAPPIVASTLADRSVQQSGGTLDAHPVSSARQARDEVREGVVVAAIDIDLRRARATLFVASAQGTRVTDSVAASIMAATDSFGTKVETVDVVPLPDVRGAAWALRALVALAVAVGLGLVVVVTWRRGPVADTRPEGLRRLLGVVVSAVLGGAVLATIATSWIGGSWPGWWGLLALTSASISVLTLGLESVLGVAGLGLAVTATVATGAPLLGADRADLLAQPWRSVTPWLPHGAALDAARDIAFFGGPSSVDVRPVLVLAAWTVVSWVVVVVARRERRRAGVRWSAEADASAR